MNIIFSKIGYEEVSSEEKGNSVVLLQINNPDGSPRWIWNANCKKPLFLKFYNIGSKRALVFALLIRFVFFIRIQRFVFKSITYFYKNQTKHFFDIEKDWALFTGTVGPNNKAILYANQSFYKIATTENAQKLIQNEHEILQKVLTKEPSFTIPLSEKIGPNIVQLADVSNNGQRVKSIEQPHLDALLEMSRIDRKKVKVSEWNLFQELKRDFYLINDHRIPKNICRKIDLILQNISSNDEVELALSQGDFTQWNMYEKNGKLSIYDWELASNDKSLGFDFFHFIIQNGILVDRKNWRSIYQDIVNSNRGLFSQEVFDNDSTKLHEGLKWYLLINCMHYLKVYADQKEWHVQIDWLLQVWGDSFNLFVNDTFSARQLIIMDFFDAIQNKDYASLKLKNEAPELLSLNSDIDIVIPKALRQFIHEFSSNHSLVSKVSIVKKSFMDSVLAYTKEGQILSIDLIWQLKRRNLEILQAHEVIQNQVVNDYGVKCASPLDTARYIVLFYVLNNAKIPEKYLEYQKAIQDSEADFDKELKKGFDTEHRNKAQLLQFIKANPKNKKGAYLKNTINYSLDTMKNSKSNSGFVVTFSGVDGAGKSTIIENVTQLIEKQLRKQVVVIRHRPSILPILSVWSKGKEKAHRDTISNLPRQGTNKNFISSLIRFAYYYSDYLFGQFVIYFKYTFRGKVVVYDRYYFDFINDSKRSNIVLPKNITRFCYTFLLKPKFNFFLYADADVILKRKQELDKVTIENLTNDYQELFAFLQQKDKSSVYMPINNIVLDETLELIMNTIKQA